MNPRSSVSLRVTADIAAGKGPASEIALAEYGTLAMFWAVALTDEMSIRDFARLLAYFLADTWRQRDLISQSVLKGIDAGIRAGAIAVIGHAPAPSTKGGEPITTVVESALGKATVTDHPEPDDDRLIDPHAAIDWLAKSRRWRHLVPVSLSSIRRKPDPLSRPSRGFPDELRGRRCGKRAAVASKAYRPTHLWRKADALAEAQRQFPLLSGKGFGRAWRAEAREKN